MNPSLALIPCAYDTGKLYSVLPDTGLGDFTVSRNGTGTYLGADGLLKTAQPNEPRLEFNTDGTFKGVLVEPAGTNELLGSEEFENVYWNKNAVIITLNDLIAPDGNLTADLITATSTNQPRVEQSISIPTVNTTYTFSVFAKAGSSPFLALSRFVNNKNALFNLSTGVIINQSVGVNATITNVGNGWYRVSITDTVLTTNTNSLWKIHPCNEFGWTASNVGNSVYIWGAQLEVGSVATSYIPTVASTVTRPADVISKTGIADLINSPEGSFYVDMSAVINGGVFRGISLSDGTDSNRISLLQSSVADRLLIILAIGGVFGVNTNIIPFTQTSFNKVLVKWGSGNFKVFVNAVLRLNLSSIGMPTTNLFTKLGFDRGINSSNYEGYVKGIQVYKTQLTDAQAIALTTL